MSAWCRTCDGYTKLWCGHDPARPRPCSAIVLVPLISDDFEGEKPHAFPCDLEAGHDGVHSATVTWLDGEE